MCISLITNCLFVVFGVEKAADKKTVELYKIKAYELHEKTT